MKTLEKIGFALKSLRDREKINNFLLIALFTSISLTAFGQKKYLALRDAPLEPPITGFFIEHVVDSRSVTDKIGYVTIGAQSREVPADLARGLANAFSNYLKKAVPKEEGASPIILGVDSLWLTPSAPETDQGLRAVLHASFYQQRDRYKVLLFETQVSVSGQQPPEALIRKALGQILSKFSNTDWDNPDAGSPVTDGRLKKNLNQQNIRPLNMLLFGYAAGSNATGWTLSYYRSPKSSHAGWFLPAQIAGERLQIDDRYFAQSDFLEAQLNYGMLGIGPFREISDRVYVNLNFMLLVGAESLTDRIGQQSTRLLLGLATKQSLYFIPDTEFGLIIGFGLYQRLLNSEVYKNDFGFRVEAGFKF